MMLIVDGEDGRRRESAVAAAGHSFAFASPSSDRMRIRSYAICMSNTVRRTRHSWGLLLSSIRRGAVSEDDRERLARFAHRRIRGDRHRSHQALPAQCRRRSHERGGARGASRQAIPLPDGEARARSRAREALAERLPFRRNCSCSRTKHASCSPRTTRCSVMRTGRSARWSASKAAPIESDSRARERAGRSSRSR